MLWFISFTLQFSFSRPYFLSVKQWPFIKLCVKLQFHQPLEGSLVWWQQPSGHLSAEIYPLLFSDPDE